MSERVRVQGGKLYTRVVDRLTAFKEKYHPDGGYTIKTEITTLTDNYVVFKAVILSTDGVILSTGHGFNAIAKEKSLEKAETVAVGRALAFFDPQYGGESELASQEEMEKFEEMTKDDGSQIPQTQPKNIDLTKKLQNQVDQAKQKMSNGASENSDTDVYKLDAVCNFKKHKGKMWSEVADEDRDYISWVLSNIKDLDANTETVLKQFA